MSATFKLRFDLSQVQHWAAEYSYKKDDSHLELVIGPRSKSQGFFTCDDFWEVCEWKSERPRKHCRLNSEVDIKAVTSLALATADEQLRIHVLTALRGVEMRTASAILHFAGRDRYPILDVRALWSLNVDTPPNYYGFNLWWAYTEFCRQLADQAHVSMRTLDRALWQFSEKNQKRIRPCLAEQK